MEDIISERNRFITLFEENGYNCTSNKLYDTVTDTYASKTESTLSGFVGFEVWQSGSIGLYYEMELEQSVFFVNTNPFDFFENKEKYLNIYNIFRKIKTSYPKLSCSTIGKDNYWKLKLGFIGFRLELFDLIPHFRLYTHKDTIVITYENALDFISEVLLK